MLESLDAVCTPKRQVVSATGVRLLEYLFLLKHLGSLSLVLAKMGIESSITRTFFHKI